MDKLNELGFVPFWGATPALNIFHGENNLLNDKIININVKTRNNDNNNKSKEVKISAVEEKLKSLNIKSKKVNSKTNEKENVNGNLKQIIRILLSNCIDLRHILKTLYFLDEYLNNKQLNSINLQEDFTLEFYIFETFQENIVRYILLIKLLTDKDFTNMEKIDLFLEIYGNTFLSEKCNQFLINSTKFIEDLIYSKKVDETYENNIQFNFLSEIFDFSNLSYKELDCMKEILDSYYDKVNFDIEKLREERLRFLYKDRYDYRENLIDWDYQMKTRKFLDFMGFKCYQRFRNSGICFSRYNIKYNKPNKTLSSYIPGRSVSKNLKIIIFRKQPKTLF